MIDEDSPASAGNGLAAQNGGEVGRKDDLVIGDDGWLSEAGRAVQQRVESRTDDLAAKPYESLEADELDELMAALEPLATLLLAAQD